MSSGMPVISTILARLSPIASTDHDRDDQQDDGDGGDVPGRDPLPNPARPQVTPRPESPQIARRTTAASSTWTLQVQGGEQHFSTCSGPGKVGLGS
jgi:hypothetical protein